MNAIPENPSLVSAIISIEFYCKNKQKTAGSLTFSCRLGRKRGKDETSPEGQAGICQVPAADPRNEPES